MLLLKILLIAVIVVAALFVLTFTVYFFNLDMKLMRSVVLPFLDKHHDSVERQHII